MVIDTQASNGTVNAGISGESNDGVSTTYNTLSAKEAVVTIQQELENTIKLYLTGIRNSFGRKLLYRGVYPNE